MYTKVVHSVAYADARFTREVSVIWVMLMSKIKHASSKNGPVI